MPLLDAKTIQQTLRRLSYWNDRTTDDFREDNFREALRRFQADTGLTPDGWYGPQCDAVLRRLAGQLDKAPPGFKQSRRWRLTSYYVAAEGEKAGNKVVPIPDVNGKPLALVSAGDYAAAALEGTIRMKDGRLLNVASVNVKVKHDDYAGVLEIARRNQWIPDKAGYAGLVLDRTGTRVVAVSAFAAVPAARYGVGYGIQKGIALEPFRTLAADIGFPKYRNVEPRFKGKGGVCPPGTKVFILDMVGVSCPDGKGGTFLHDGWLQVNDTGGAIFGAHFDVFVGNASLFRPVRHPHIGHIWFEGIEEKLEPTYSYGI